MEKGTRFRRKLNRIIKSLLGTSGLIIDVRGNRGGSREAIFVLLPYFISEPTIINVAALRIDQSINPLIKDSYGLESRFLYLRQSMAFSDQEKKIIDDYLAADLMDEIFPNERFSLLHFAIASPKIDGKRQYENPVIILMDSRTLSAAEIFLAAFQTQPQVFLMGSPSCGHSGFSRTFRLPFSGYDVHMSTMLSFLPNGQMIEDRGIQADIFQPLTLEDKLGKRDSQLDSAVAYLRRSIR